MNEHRLPKATVEALRVMSFPWVDASAMRESLKTSDLAHPTKGLVRAVGYARAILKIGPHEVATTFSMSPGWVSRITRLNRLPDNVLDLLSLSLPDTERLTFTEALCLSRMEARKPEDYERMAANMLKRSKTSLKLIRLRSH